VSRRYSYTNSTMVGVPKPSHTITFTLHTVPFIAETQDNIEIYGKSG
jgi:hypothetical protein